MKSPSAQGSCCMIHQELCLLVIPKGSLQPNRSNRSTGRWQVVGICWILLWCSLRGFTTKCLVGHHDLQSGNLTSAAQRSCHVLVLVCFGQKQRQNEENGRRIDLHTVHAHCTPLSEQDLGVAGAPWFPKFFSIKIQKRETIDKPHNAAWVVHFKLCTQTVKEASLQSAVVKLAFWFRFNHFKSQFPNVPNSSRWTRVTCVSLSLCRDYKITHNRTSWTSWTNQLLRPQICGQSSSMMRSDSWPQPASLETSWNSSTSESSLKMVKNGHRSSQIISFLRNSSPFALACECDWICVIFVWFRFPETTGFV